jgi:hypothetical protein
MLRCWTNRQISSTSLWMREHGWLHEACQQRLSVSSATAQCFVLHVSQRLPTGDALELLARSHSG